MKHYTSLIIILCLVGISALVVVTPSGCRKEDPQSKEIKIGSTLPLTGDAAAWGNNTKEGIELALKEINDKGGVKGRKLVVVYEDTEALPQKGVGAYQKLTTVDKVPAIIDDSVSTVTLAMAPLAEKDHVVVLAVGASAPKVSEAGDYTFRIWNSDTYEAEITADYAHSTLKLKNIAILYINTDYGTGLEQFFTKCFAAKGGRIALAQSFEQNVFDMRSQLTKIKAANPDGIYFVGYPREIPVALRQAKELGIKAQFLGTAAMQDRQLIQAAGDAAEGTIYPYQKDPKGEEVELFQASFKKKYGKDPGITADVGYDAAKMISKAIELSGGFSGENIRKGLNMLKGYLGASGVMTFDENGDVHKPMGMKIVRDGQFVWLEQ